MICGAGSSMVYPPIPLNVGDADEYDDQFATLSPGDLWTTTLRKQSSSTWTVWPHASHVGDRFKFVTKDDVVNW